VQSVDSFPALFPILAKALEEAAEMKTPCVEYWRGVHAVTSASGAQQILHNWMWWSVAKTIARCVLSASSSSSAEAERKASVMTSSGLPVTATRSRAGAGSHEVLVCQ
jgi:hypothetical protein